VGYDTGQLGERAGEWLAGHLKNIRRPHVLIIASKEHDKRQEECARVLRRELKGVTETTIDTCEFSRSRAREAVRRHVESLPPRQCLHAIFCTDDEMGLGAVDALATPNAATTATVVIGIDGIAEATSLIDAGTTPFRATVVQNTHELALRIVDHLTKMHEGRTPAKPKTLTPKIHEKPL
jgi:ribose transport system substrate-binding protein